MAPAFGADEPFAPIENSGLSAISLGLLGGIRLYLMAAISAPHDEADAGGSGAAKRHRRARFGFQC
jgi:hypothetical protein